MNFKNLSIILLALVIYSCAEVDEIEAKRNELTEAKEQLFTLKASISKLERELVELGVVTVNTNQTLVSTVVINEKPFIHRVDVRGEVNNCSNVSERNIFMPSGVCPSLSNRNRNACMSFADTFKAPKARKLIFQ